MFCEPTRAQIARSLSPGPLAVSEIASVIGRSKWSTSRHLRVLRESHLVIAERRGRSVVYSLSEAAVPAINSLAVISEAAA